jgi:HD-GYP domain-containing protein (c-di-GMP phosphodiesterase class II)
MVESTARSSLSDDARSQVRLAELVAALSLVVDLGLGQPMEHVLRQTLIAIRLGEELGMSEEERAALYYISHLAWIGCGSDSHELATWFGDDISFRAGAYKVDLAGLPALAYMVRNLGAGRRPLERARTAFSFVARGASTIASSATAHCLTTKVFAERLGLGPEIQDPLLQMFERWDGKGEPEGLEGDQISLPTRIVQLADIVTAFHRGGGIEAATAVARQRRGSQFDPFLADRFCASAHAILGSIHDEISWEQLLSSEPSAQAYLSPPALDHALEAVADFTDLKCVYTVGHARAVARLASEAAVRLNLPQSEVERVRRAALVQDAGRMGVSNAIWDKRGPLTQSEIERVRLHPYFVERMLSTVPGLEKVGALAAQHHERLDGSGYPRGITGAGLSTSARILGAADVYQALMEERPHRPAFDTETAAKELRAEVRAGRLDGDAADAVLAAAGHRVRRRRQWPAGLTAREVEILALIARGHTNKEVARRLHVAEKTVGNHVEHIYTKIGSSTRAEASLFAMQKGLLDLSGPPER